MRLTLLLALSSALAFGESNDSAKLSEALGHLIGKTIDQLDLSLDLKALAKGLEDEAAGKESPLTAEECQAKLEALREQKLRALADQHLAEAVAFFVEQGPALSTIIKNKLHYKIAQEGKGEPLLPHDSPLVRFTAKTLSGQIDSEGELTIDLQEAIPAFQLGLVGMKEGEKRTLYVHPSLSSPGKTELLIIDVELIQVHPMPPSPDPLTATSSR